MAGSSLLCARRKHDGCGSLPDYGVDWHIGCGWSRTLGLCASWCGVECLVDYSGWQHFTTDTVRDYPMENGPECVLWDSDDGEDLWDEDVWRVLSLVPLRAGPDTIVHVFTSLRNFRFGSHASRGRFARERSENDTVVHEICRRMGHILVTIHTVEGIMSGVADRSAVFGIFVFVANLYVVFRYLGYIQWNGPSQLRIERG